MAVNLLDRVSGPPLVILITIASSCGFLLFGYDNGKSKVCQSGFTDVSIAVFSGILVLPWFLETFHHPKTSLLGTISATYNLGGFLGSMLAFFCGNYLGRRGTILAGICITSIGAIVQCVATDLAELVPGRIITGFGVGAMTSTIGLWQAETVPARFRGRYLCLQLLAGAGAGSFFAQWINYGFHASKTRAAFTFPLAFQFVFLVLCGTLVIMLPESPRWLVKKGRTQQAREILSRLQRTDDVDERLARIVEADELEKSIKGNSYAVLFSRGPTRNLQRLGLCVATMIFHQLNGINSVTYYMPTLLTTFAKVSHDTSLWVTGLLSVTSMISALVPVLTIDRIGRRPFLYIGALWQTATFSVLAALLANAPTSGPRAHSFGVGAVVMVFLYYAGNAASWLPVSWCYRKYFQKSNFGSLLLSSRRDSALANQRERTSFRQRLLLALPGAYKSSSLWQICLQ